MRQSTAIIVADGQKMKGGGGLAIGVFDRMRCRGWLAGGSGDGRPRVRRRVGLAGIFVNLSNHAKPSSKQNNLAVVM